MTVGWKLMDRTMPERVSGGLVGRDGRGVCGSHQLKDDRCGGGEMVGWGCTPQIGGKKGVQRQQILFLEHAEVGNPRPASRLRDGDWDW